MAQSPTHKEITELERITASALERLQRRKLPEGDTLVAESTPTQIPHRTTRPDAIQRHDISDEELDMLTETRRERLVEAFWAMVGIAIGALYPAVNALQLAFLGPESAKAPLMLGDLLQILLCGGAIAVGATLLIIETNRGRRQVDIVDKIRNRKNKES